jgi:hypothetical protein
MPTAVTRIVAAPGGLSDRRGAAVDPVERSLQELEQQHTEAQRMLSEAVAKLQQLFDDIEAQADELSQLAAIQVDENEPTLQARLDQALQERDALQEQLLQRDGPLPVDAAPPANSDSMADTAEPPSPLPPGAAALRMPFEVLRRSFEKSSHDA